MSSSTSPIASSSTSTSAIARSPSSFFHLPSGTLVQTYRDAIKDAVDEANARSDFGTLPYGYWYGVREDFRIRIAFEQVLEDRRMARRREREAIAITPPRRQACDDCPACVRRSHSHTESRRPHPNWRNFYSCPHCSFRAEHRLTVEKHYRKKHLPR